MLSDNEAMIIASPSEPQWTTRFYEYLDQKPGAKEEWDELAFGGNYALLMLLASMDHCSELEVLRVELRLLVDVLEPTIRVSQSLSELAEETNRDISALRADISEFSDMPEKLRKYSRYLQDMKGVATGLSSSRLPGTADYILFFLHSYISHLNGQPKWNALATLLEAAHFAKTRKVIFIESESLRKRIAGLRKRDPGRCSNLDAKAAQYLAEGNGGWPTRQQLEEILENVMCQLDRERAETILPK